MPKKNSEEILADSEIFYKTLNDYFQENQYSMSGNIQAILQTVLTNIGLLTLTLKKTIERKDEMGLNI